MEKKEDEAVLEGEEAAEETRLLLHSACIVTMGPDAAIYKDGALLITGGNITAIGKTEAMLAQYGSSSQVHDLSGRRILPSKKLQHPSSKSHHKLCSFLSWSISIEASASLKEAENS